VANVFVFNTSCINIVTAKRQTIATISLINVCLLDLEKGKFVIDQTWRLDDLARYDPVDEANGNTYMFFFSIDVFFFFVLNSNLL
jgi:hypothetical protein